MPKKTSERPFTGRPAQVVVILKEEAGPVLSRLEGATARKGSAPEAALQTTPSTLGVPLAPLFGETESHVAKLVTRATEAAPPALKENIRRMNSFYTLATTPKTDLEKVVSDLNKLDIVEGAYIKPIGEPLRYAYAARNSFHFARSLRCTAGFRSFVKMR